MLTSGNRRLERADQLEKSGREDLNLRPPRPERGALPDCATSRLRGLIISASQHAACGGLSAFQLRRAVRRSRHPPTFLPANPLVIRSPVRAERQRKLKC